MENARVDKNRTVGTSSVAWGMWDPFWFMRDLFGWGRAAAGPSFDVRETDDTYVCKVNVKLRLPEQADAAHLKAELDDGELTLVVPKLAAVTPEPKRRPEQERKSAGRRRRRGARTRARRG